MRPVSQNELMIGNFISVMGRTVMVTGITPREDGTYFLSYNSPVYNDGLPGVEFSAYPIRYTAAWRKVLDVGHRPLPDYVEYVHQVQNLIRAFTNCDPLKFLTCDAVPARQPDDEVLEQIESCDETD